MTNPKHLIRRIQDNRAFRERESAYAKWEAERRQAIDSAPRMQWTEFWCDECKTDVIAMGWKKRNDGYDLTNGVSYEVKPVRAWYVGRCKRDHYVQRNITDRNADRYFVLSEKLKRERIDAGDDMLQPSDPRFAMVYPKQWEKIQAEREEERIRNEYTEHIENLAF